jgi:lipoprotein NlpD
MPLCQLDRRKRVEKINPSFKSIIFIFLAVFLIFSCFKPQLQKAQAMGVYHLVKKNETVWSIAKAYGVSVQELAENNNITDTNSIKENSVIFIPSASQVVDSLKDVNNDANTKTEKNNSDSVKDVKLSEGLKEESSIEIKQSKKEDIQEPSANIVQNKKSSDKKNESQYKAPAHEKKISAGKNIFIWPVRGDIKAHFGVQPNRTLNNWIKIVSTAGKKIKAAESGTVIFSSDLKDYGETVIIRHKDNFATVYTHLKKRYVKIDKNVKKGETIAILGEKDEAGEVFMNFEIRMKGKAHDPLLFLP